MEPQYETGIDALAEDHPAPSGRRPILPGWARDPDTWIVAGVAIVALALLAGALWLLWWIVTTVLAMLAVAGQALLDAGGTTGRWLASGPVTQVITDPIHGYLEHHAAGLPATAGQLWWTWLTATAALFVLARLGSRAARLGWVLIGAVTAAMVWAGSAPTSRDLAAGVAVVAWSLLSVFAFTAAGRRRLPLPPTAPPSRSAPASDNAESVAV